MDYHDDIYGSVTITEPVLLDLLASRAVQRLHGVMQHGITGIIGLTAPVTRFEHSVGAMLLVRRLGGSVTEQVAALLHDVSHTAFSHVIDYVYDDHDGQSYHDRYKEVYVTKTDLPNILASHSIAWQDVLDEAQFPILEQPAPRLCADRVDYFLRDARPLGLASTEEVAHALAHLCLANGRIVTDDIDVARWLADTYMAADEASWSNFREVGLYELTARALRRGFEIGLISDEDIWGIDAPLWTKLQAATDNQLHQLVQAVSPQTEFAWDEANPTFWVSTKIRTIDPDVVSSVADANNAYNPQPLSALDAAFAQRRQDYLTRKGGKWPMRVVGLDEGI
ncbi:MAG: HD domain-containing protein [Chloroflexota bacterium]